MLVAALGIFHANVRRAAQAVVILTKGKMNTDSNDLQQNIIRKLTTLLKKENIVAALFLKGSIARGTADRYSDIDYYCLIHKNSMQEIMDKRKKLVTSIGKIIYLGFHSRLLTICAENHLLSEGIILPWVAELVCTKHI
jgi:predicted nucleotidyltransferase